FGNPRAIAEGVRFTETNLNRCFIKGGTGTSYEEIRARELIDILDQCDGLLDIHGFNGDEKEPFIICEEPSIELAKSFPVNYLVTNLSNIGIGGTDGYMFNRGKLAVCLECGPNQKFEDYIELATDCINLFLQYFNILDSDMANKVQSDPRIFSVKAIVKKQTDQLSFDTAYHNFDRLVFGAVFAQDGVRKYIAEEGDHILFPRPNQKIG